MATPHQEIQPLATTDSLWLEVQLNDERWLFELRDDDDAAIAVGSHPSAQIHIVSPGIATTHFHFERERTEIVAVPGYRAGLRVNSIKAPGPTRLAEHSTIDFCGISVKVRIHRKPPEDFRGHIGKRTSTPAEYLRALPGDSDTTGIALPAAPSLYTLSSFETMAAAPPRFRTEGLVPLGAAPLPSDGPALGPQGTAVMRVVRPEIMPVTQPTKAELPFDPSRTERIPIAKSAGDAGEHMVSHESTPTRVEVPAPRRSSAPPPEAERPRPVVETNPSTPVALVVPLPAQATMPVAPVVPTRSLLPQSDVSTKTADFDVAAMAPFFVTPATGIASAPGPTVQANGPFEPAPAVKSVRAPASSPRPTRRAPAWLTTIGRAAQQRPVPVAAVALVTSLVLALALVGAARLTSARRGASHPRTHDAGSSISIASSAAVASFTDMPKGNPAPPTPAPLASTPSAPVDSRQLFDATTHLSSGRYVEAAVAYRALASVDTMNTAYAGVVSILDRALSPRCRQKPPASGCPEVIP